MTDHEGLYFRLLNEIGIIAQLSRTLLEARLTQGMIAPHFTVLNHLVRVSDGRTPLELARAFQVPKTSMTHTLNGLLKHGFVEIRPNPADGRSKRVWLTAAGRTFRQQAVQALEQDFGTIMAAFTPDQARAMLPTLETLRRILDEKRCTNEESDRRL